MKRLCALPVLSLLFLLAACKEKDTVINGRVIDKHSGVPIPEVQITFVISHDDSKYPEYATVFSDENGQFASPQRGGTTGTEVFEMKKAGYLEKGGGTKVVGSGSQVLI
jgi:5-hydroxyisourate hydrolase-like protein (transthyretin family)